MKKFISRLFCTTILILTSLLACERSYEEQRRLEFIPKAVTQSEFREFLLQDDFNPESVKYILIKN